MRNEDTGTAAPCRIHSAGGQSGVLCACRRGYTACTRVDHPHLTTSHNYYTSTDAAIQFYWTLVFNTGLKKSQDSISNLPTDLSFRTGQVTLKKVVKSLY